MKFIAYLQLLFVEKFSGYYLALHIDNNDNKMTFVRTFVYLRLL